VPKNSDRPICIYLHTGLPEWLSVSSAVQTCIWPSWCHCHSLSLDPVKSRLVLPFWYRLTWVVPDKGPLNGCVCVCVGCRHQWTAAMLLSYTTHTHTHTNTRLTALFPGLPGQQIICYTGVCVFWTNTTGCQSLVYVTNGHSSGLQLSIGLCMCI